MPILTEAHYPAIRAALDVLLTKSQLPDSIIQMDIYQNAADQDVIELVPDAESKTGQDLTHVQNAAVLFCAARLAGAVTRVTSQTITAQDVSYSRETFDPTEKAGELRRMAREELEKLGEGTAVRSRPDMFVRATGSRGQ